MERYYPSLQIDPVEPRESNAWHLCPMERATAFQVFAGDELLATFPTYTAAAQFVRDRQGWLK